MLANVLLDPFAALLVFGGSLAVAAVRSTRRDVACAFAALKPLFFTRADEQTRAARVAVNRIAERAHGTGLATADRAPVIEQFLARAAARLADTADPSRFTAWAEAELAARAERHASVHAVWRAAADVAPAMGMIGTVIGLIHMFSAMDDPAAIGPGMALALTTTLYGIAAANLVFGAIAARLERLSRIELLWQRDALDKLATIAREELAGPIERRALRIAERLRAA